MKILVLSQHYKPEPISKPFELADSLNKLGHEVTVLTAFPNYPYGKFYNKIRGLWEISEEEGIKVIRMAFYPNHGRSLFLRIFSYLTLAFVMILTFPFLLKKQDVMYVWHPPTTIGVVALFIRVFKNVPYLYGVHDLWPENVESVGMLNKGILYKVISATQTMVYRRASAVGISSPSFYKYIENRGVPPHRIHHLSDWSDEDVFFPKKPDIILSKKHGMNDKFNVIFGGQIGIAQGLHTVVEAAKILSDLEDIRFTLLGDGNDKDKLVDMVSKSKLRNVKFMSQVDQSTANEFFNIADVLLVNLIGGFVSDVSVPSKTYAYMAVGKPVIMAAGLAGSDLILSTGGGVCCEPENAQSLASGVLEIYEMESEEIELMGRANRRTYLNQYSRSVGVKLHENILISVAKTT